MDRKLESERMVKRKSTKGTSCQVCKPCPAIGTGRVGELVCYRCRLEHLDGLLRQTQPLLKKEAERVKNELARLKLPNRGSGDDVLEQVRKAQAKDKTVYRTLNEFNEASKALWDRIESSQDERDEDEANIPPGAVLSTIPTRVLKELSAAAGHLFDHHWKMSEWAWREFKKCGGCGEDIRVGKYCAACRREEIPKRDMAKSRARAITKAKRTTLKEQAEKLRRTKS